MREIKFRAWCNVTKQMESNAAWLAVEFSNNIIGTHNGKRFDRNSYILLQYTGLKDKNGVEIYEGDIVELIFTTVNTSRKIKKQIYDIYHADRWLRNNTDEFEIIGNIHENPELLK